MMNEDQAKTVVRVYNYLLDTESRGWDDLDEYIEHLDYLDDDQLHREADVVYEGHKNVSVRCHQIHAREKCFIPALVDAVGAILELYKDKAQLHVKNKYILQYYLAMNQAGMIVVDVASAP